MALFQDQESGAFLADSSRSPLDDTGPIDTPIISSAFGDFILSASGWRKLFGKNEEDTSPHLRSADKLLIAAAGLVFSRFVRKHSGTQEPLVAVGIDSRYTGPRIADILIRVLIGRGIRVRFLSITPSPEIMAYTKLCPEIDAFAYVTASHNPVGYNGLKFGRSDGAVLGGREAAALIETFRSWVSDSFSQVKLSEAAAAAGAETVEAVYSKIDIYKKEAERYYRTLIGQVISGRETEEAARQLTESLETHIAGEGLGIVIDMNGSARCRGIDTALLTGLGIEVRTVNGRAGEIRHEIIPEGASLDLCRNTLAEEYARDRRFKLAYMPDNDGDRGNIVFMDEEQGLPIVLEAQEVFALVCLAELAWMEYIGLLQTKDSGSAGSRPPDGSPGPAGTYSAGTRRDQACSQTAGPVRTAVVVNGPTSLRIERICAAFGVETRRAEVGEANVVGKAAELRNNGVRVRILGEGSNGGTICHPATVRDPLATVFSFIKLLYVRSQPGRPGLFELWCRKSGQAAAFKADYSLRDILRSLPCFKTTETGDPRAKMQIKNPDYHNLKLKYESLFMRQWNERTQLLKEEYGIYSWKEVNYEGSREKRGFGPSCRSGLEKGGLKILFSDRAGRDKAFIWMRPSGTEPVFRIAADAECRPAGGSAAALHGGAEGRSSLHDYLLHWQRDMIEEADLMIGS